MDEDIQRKKDEWYAARIVRRRELNRQLHNYRMKIYAIREEMKSIVSERDKITNELSVGRTFEQRGAGQFAYSADDVRDYIVTYLRDDSSTQKRLSEQSNVSVQTIYRILKGKRQFISEETAERLFIAMGCEWVLSTLDVFPNPMMIGRPPQTQYYEE